jgi:hypothetical protein
MEAKNQRWYVAHEKFIGKALRFDELNHDYLVVSQDNREVRGEIMRTIQWTCNSREAAIAAVHEYFPDYQECARVYDGSAVWFERKHKIMTADATWDVCLPVLKEISADSSDDELRQLIAKRNEWARQNMGCGLLWLTAWNLFVNHRDRLANEEESNRSLM